MARFDSIRRLWQGRQERAVAMAEDAQHGLSAPPGSAGATAVGIGPAVDQGHLAMQVPVAPEGAGQAQPVQVVEAKNADGTTSIYGVPGTLITSGFLIPWEPNPLLAGRLGVDMYHKMRSSDTQVDKTLEMCFQPILSAKWDVVPAEESAVGSRQSAVSNTGAGKATDAKKKEIAAAAKQNLFNELGYWAAPGLWQAQSWNEVLRNSLLMLAFGCCAHERVFRIDGDMLKFARFADLPPRTYYRWDVQPDGRTLRALIQLGFRREYFSQLEVPAERITLFVHRQEGADFWGRSMLRPAYPHWQVKNMLYKVRSLAAERNQLGVPCITLPANAGPEDKTAAYEFVTSLAAHKKTGLVLPSGAVFKIHGVEGSLYDSMPDVVHHNEQISYVALDFFSNLGRGAGGAQGNRSLGVSQGKFFNLALQNVANYIAQRFSQSDLRYWTVFNYGADAPVPVLRVSNVQARSFEEVMEILIKGAEAGLVRSDKGIRAEVRNETAMPLETVEDVITARGVTDSVGPETGTVGAGTEQPEAGKGGGRSAGRLVASETQRLSDSVVKPNRELKEFEKKHDFQGHVERADKTARQVARALRGMMPDYVNALAANASQRHVADIPNAAVALPHALAMRVEKILGVARRYGKDQVYAERKKATGRGKNQPPVILSEAKDLALAADLPKKKVTAWFNAQATIADFSNEVSKRVKARTIDLAKDGLEGDDLAGSVSKDVLGATDGWIDRLGDEAGRAAVAAGRDDAFADLDTEIGSYVRSEVIDHNTCPTCADGDGTEWKSYDEIDWQPGDDCEGGDACRGQIIPVFEDEGTVTLE